MLQNPYLMLNWTYIFFIITGDISTNLYPRPLEFDPRKHKILNTELQRLYTAVTRARTNVWIFDEDEECRLPMFDYFIKRNLVEVKDGKLQFFHKDLFFLKCRMFGICCVLQC